jgi:hypothetical protein
MPLPWALRPGAGATILIQGEGGVVYRGRAGRVHTSLVDAGLSKPRPICPHLDGASIYLKWSRTMTGGVRSRCERRRPVMAGEVQALPGLT